MTAKELIEKRIEEASNAIVNADDWARKVNLVFAFNALSACCGRLLQVVQNQQAQIEELQEMNSEDEPQDVVRVEVCARARCEHPIDRHSLFKGCCVAGCLCSQFCRGEAKR